MVEKPEYEPAYTIPRWVSDRDVANALKDILDSVVAEREGDATKAICWDIRARFRHAMMGIRNG